MTGRTRVLQIANDRVIFLDIQSYEPNPHYILLLKEIFLYENLFKDSADFSLSVTFFDN